MIANVVNNQGFLSRDRGDIDLAFKYLKEALEIRRKIDDKFGIARSYLSLGELYFVNLKDYEKAEEYLKQAVLIGREVSSLPTVNEAFGHLHKLYQAQGDFKNAYESLQNFE